MADDPEIVSTGLWRALDRAIFALRGRGRALLLLVAGLYLLAWLAGGVFAVETQKTGVLRRFGRLVDDAVPPGLHYRLPSPVDEVAMVPTAGVQRLEVRPAAPGVSTGESSYVTGDENLIDVSMAVQYKVRDAAAYLFSTDAHERLLAGAAQSALTEALATMPVDEVLTVGKGRIERYVHDRTQKIVDGYGIGLSVLSATIASVDPPKEVSFDFKAVSDAKAEARKIVSEAESKRNDLIPKARGRADKIVSEAESYRTDRTARAQGDAQRFLAILAEYEKARETTETRLYLETLEKVLPKVKKYVLSKSEDGRSPKVNLR